MKVFSIINYTFAAAGIVLLIVAFLSYAHTKDFLEDALTTEGTVVQLIATEFENSVTYRPLVEYKTRIDKMVKFTSPIGSNPPSYTKGEMVVVIYHDAWPEKARIDSFFSLWGFSLIFSILGSIFLIVGVLQLLFERFKRRKIQKLRSTGLAITARFQSVKRNTRLKVNGRNP